MKRLLTLAVMSVVAVLCCMKASAGNFGIIGGVNFLSTSIKEINADTKTQWHAGITYKLDLPAGFQFQPALLYNVKGAKIGDKMVNTDLSVGYAELLASVQWGLDLIAFRPFVDVSPFIGYATNGTGGLKGLWKEVGNRFEWGVGIGGGIDIWRFQIAARYNWNFGRIMDATLDQLKEVSVEGLRGANFNGVTLSLAYFF